MKFRYDSLAGPRNQPVLGQPDAEQAMTAIGAIAALGIETQGKTSATQQQSAEAIARRNTAALQETNQQSVQALVDILTTAAAERTHALEAQAADRRHAREVQLQVVEQAARVAALEQKAEMEKNTCSLYMNMFTASIKLVEERLAAAAAREPYHAVLLSMEPELLTPEFVKKHYTWLQTHFCYKVQEVDGITWSECAVCLCCAHYHAEEGQEWLEVKREPQANRLFAMRGLQRKARSWDDSAHALTTHMEGQQHESAIARDDHASKAATDRRAYLDGLLPP